MIISVAEAHDSPASGSGWDSSQSPNSSKRFCEQYAAQVSHRKHSNINISTVQKHKHSEEAVVELVVVGVRSTSLAEEV